MDKLRDGQVDRLVVRDQDFHGRRITNASPSKDPYDYVVRKELDDALAVFDPSSSASSSGNSSIGGVLVKTGNYSAISSDDGKLIVFNSASAVSYTLQSPPPSSTWNVHVENIGAGLLTINRNTLTIDGAASNLDIVTSQGVYLGTNGSNYYTERGITPTFPTIPAVGGAIVKTGNYTGVAGDSGKIISFSSGSALAYTLPAAPPSATWAVFVQNVGAGTLTVGRNSLTIDAAASDLTLLTKQGVYISTDGTNYFTERGLTEPITYPYDLWCALVGSPIGSQIVFLGTFNRTVNFLGNFSGSVGKVGTNPTATATYDIQKNGSSIGGISINTSGVVSFTSTSGAAQSFASGDIIKIVFQSSADATLANVGFTLAGTR